MIEKDLEKEYAKLYDYCHNEWKCRHYLNLTCKGKGKFSIKPKMPFVGEKYGKDNVPKVLFISADPAHDYKNLHTIDDLRKEENRPHNGQKGKHWGETFALGKILTEQRSDEYFAHTNAAKCCQNKENNKEADKRLFDNCRDFLKQELSVFKADIIVTQHRYAKLILDSYKKVLEPIILDVKNPKYKIRELEIYAIDMNGKQTLFIPTDHPRHCSTYWAHKDAIKNNMNKIKEILSTIDKKCN
jgi:uracil-DNA glycosylase